MRWLFASILFLYFHISNAQLPADIKFTNYTRANGLPEENINNITQDSRGFIWIGSREGLIRFDGLHYKTWYANPSDSTKFSNNNILLISEYKPGYLLFQSGNSLWQINIFNHKLSQLSRFKDVVFLGRPQQLANGQWCLGGIDSLYITSSSLEVIYSIPLNQLYPSNTLVSAFPLQHPFTLLHSANINRFYLLNYVSRKTIPITIDESGLDSRSKYFIPAAYDSLSKRLYLSAYFNGNFYCDVNFPQVTSYKPVNLGAQKDGAIRKSILLNGDRMIQGGENGLYITDFKTSIVFNRNSKSDKPIAANTVLDLYQGADKSYWASTTKGISHFSLDKPAISYWQNLSTGADDDEFKSIIKDNDGKIYFLSQNKSLCRIDKTTGLFHRIDSALWYCWSAVLSGNEIIFSGAGKKLALYNISTGKISYPDFLKPFYSNNTDLVTLVFTTKNGDKWYSCNGSAGLIRNPSGTNQFIHYSKNSSPPSFSLNYVHTATEDSHGNIWWGSNKTQMLLKWNASEEKFSEFEVGQLAPQSSIKTGINNLYADALDNLWIALDGAALLKYNINTKKGNYYDINKGLPTDAVFGMCSDAKNRLWFGTRKGLCCYLPEKDKLITFTSYDGLPENDFEGNGILYDKADDLVYFGAKRSIIYFNPDTLLKKVTTTRPSVFIDEMLVNGRIFYFESDKNNSLDTKENNIEFNFASPDFNRNDQIIYQYHLNGEANDWIDLNDKRSITFNNLSHGRYALSVRCKYKGTDEWNETTYPLIFTIQTPLVKTWWFRLLSGLAAASLIWIIIRNFYRRKLEKQKTEAEKIQAVEKERTRIATDMHDDFGASLSRIKFISEKMQLTEQENESLRKDLSKISEYSDEMAEKMNEIVWALNQRYDSCSDLISFCRSYASELLQDKNINLYFQSGEIPERKIQGEVRRNIFLVMKEALHNIVKHAAATEATIIFEFGNSINVNITDNGKGFDQKNVRPFANGLENMKKRIADINGEISISGENGTSISFSVPI